MAEGYDRTGNAGATWPRRRVLKALSLAGVGSVVFGRALVTLAEEQPRVTGAMIRQAEWISGVELTDGERELMLEGVNEVLESYEQLRAVTVDNSVPPALFFDPAPGAPGAASASDGERATFTESVPPVRPASDEDLAFAPVRELSALVRDRKISSVELTRLYLDRLDRYDPVLRCVIRKTEKRALDQAERLDRELASGRYRGPLHGIPWGGKDLLAVPGYKTTWGAMPYRDQVLEETATVVSRLDAAGAVLVAKLSLGALAWGDVWYDATTKNPWNVEQGSSGSSAGSASATAAGCVGFSIGTETWGSIVSPCTRCGATGLRPTFGRVSRHGAMALSWSMDKIGPIARSVEDCAVVFDAIQGADGLDPTAVSRPFAWPPRRDVRALKVGFVRSMFEEDRTADVDDDTRRRSLEEWQSFDRRTLDTLEELGVNLVPIELPDTYPVDAMSFILTAEAATAFDDLTRSGRDDEMVRQIARAWPNVFRQGQLIPAVEYIRANRVRTLVMREMEQALTDVDVYITPSFGGDNLLLTNLTGHPSVVVPNGFRSSDGTPTSITFMGRLFGEEALLAVALAYQQATDFHLARPPLAEATG
jgi:Asp-tRNA(Asn)/Glu-tRNA(Gln) amidotransferase A subunit family amidase